MFKRKNPPKGKFKLGDDGEIIGSQPLLQRELHIRLQVRWLAFGLAGAAIIVVTAMVMINLIDSLPSAGPRALEETQRAFSATQDAYLRQFYTPTARYMGESGGTAYPLLTRERIGAIPANTRVGVRQAIYTGAEWIYTVGMPDGVTVAEARESQLTYAPGVTPGAPEPTPRFAGLIGMGGFPILTREKIGEIPANTRVRISHASMGLDGWGYFIVMPDEKTSAQARETQLDFAPGITPNAPTPQARFGLMIGGNFSLVLKVAVEGLPAGTRVRVTSAHQGMDGWVYTVMTQNGTSSYEVPESQLDYALGIQALPSTPTLPPAR
jgi:hypothetical protein